MPSSTVAIRAALVCLVLAGLAGCANFQSHIDPSGRNIFLPSASPAAPAPSATAAAPGAAAPIVAAPGTIQPGLSLNPARVIAPVGSEVVLIASAAGGDGYLISGQRVEWTLAPGGVGHIVSIGQREPLDFLSCLHGLPKKVDNTFAINSTRYSSFVIDRGTPAPLDDVPIQAGQTWISVSSPVEGTSYVTAHAPAVPEWDRHKPTAAVHWVDVQFAFPAPQISPAGGSRPLVTRVVRQSDGSPLAGWGVRYEIVGGPDAVFAASGATIVEVPTDAAGQAAAEISQSRAVPGTNRVQIQVIRPADRGMGQRIVVGGGGTLQTWTAAGLSLRVSGPRQARAGETITYRVELSNAGGAEAKDVVITGRPTGGLTLVNANPAADSSPSGLEWRLAVIPAGQSRSLEANFRASAPGRYQFCAQAASAGQPGDQQCAATEVLAAGPPIVGGGPAAVDIDIQGPPAANVGQSVNFTVTITNRGPRAAQNLVITNKFDEGLEFAEGRSPLEQNLSDLPAGQSTRIGLRYRAAEAGNLCQQIELRGDGGLFRSARACVRVSAAVESSPPGPADQPRPDAERRSVEVKVKVDEKLSVGDAAKFEIEVTNTGNVRLENLRISFDNPPSLEPFEATDGVTTWNAARLDAGRVLRKQVNCTCKQATREACGRVTVRADGLAPAVEQACLEIIRAGDAAAEDNSGGGEPPEAAKAPAAGRLSVSVADTEDPVKAGDRATYVVVISNKTDSPQRDVALVVASSEDLQFVEGKGPTSGTEENKKFRFKPIAEMRVGEDVTYTITVKTSLPGTARVSAEITSRAQRAPAAAEQTTQVLKR